MAVSRTTDAKKSTAQKSPEVKADAPAEKKTRGRRATASKTEETKTASTRKTKTNGNNVNISLSPEERYKMTEVAAYYLAERNGFKGHPVDYWREAEAQISQMLGR